MSYIDKLNRYEKFLKENNLGIYDELNKLFRIENKDFIKHCESPKFEESKKHQYARTKCNWIDKKLYLIDKELCGKLWKTNQTHILQSRVVRY